MLVRHVVSKLEHLLPVLERLIIQIFKLTGVIIELWLRSASIRLFGLLLLLGAVEELRWHGLGPTHVLLSASGFTAGATILAICHLLVLVLLNFELICHAVVDHASW